MVPDFVNDLKTLREQKELGLEDLHEKTRIPVDVLKRFESGNLLSDPTYSDVYIRAFLKSYASALDKSPRRILVAYDAHKTGNYVGGLVDESGEERRSKPTPTKPNKKSEDQEETKESPEIAETSKTKKESEEKQEATEDSSSPVEALSRREEEPERDGHEAPMVRTAQNFPRRTAQRRTPERSSVDSTNWLPVLGLLAVLIIVLGGLIWYLFFYEPAEREEPTQVADQEVTSESENEPEARDDTAAPELVFPIRITVTAGGDGLQNFRVTEVPNERLGHWVEAGESVTFESDSLVVLWGQGATGLTGEATLELQGYRWAPTDRSILRIDRQRGQGLLDSLHAASLR